MQTDRGKRLRFGMVINCNVGGSEHEHRDDNELLACIKRNEEHVTMTRLSLQMEDTLIALKENLRYMKDKLNTEDNNGKYCAAAEEARASAEKARENAEKARVAAEKEVAKAEYAKTKNEEAKTKKEEAKAKVAEAKTKVEEAKAKVEEERNKRIFELLKYSGSIGMNNLRMILGNVTGSMDTTSDLYVRTNTLADSVPSDTDSDYTKRK
ncbi:putative autophagy-related protein 11 [Ruditapes philippinarum]|uniref:putative autophagy-related protein 11 n=1 Tax=Ruditapes philippinarum TaxID=129788 RepID=UPI00295B9747|nr:putative autophagy-related protein 11 [Ruditapes philippinarum]